MRARRRSRRRQSVPGTPPLVRPMGLVRKRGVRNRAMLRAFWTVRRAPRASPAHPYRRFDPNSPAPCAQARPLVALRGACEQRGGNIPGAPVPQVASCPHCTLHPHCKTAAGHPLAPRVSNQTWPADAPFTPRLAGVLSRRFRRGCRAAAAPALRHAWLVRGVLGGSSRRRF